MKWRTIVWRKMRLQGISTTVILILATLSPTLTESEGTRRSVENLQSIKIGNEAPMIPNDSKTVNVESNFGSSSAGNSPALNSFLKNVLRAQDELKWIDQAVRRVGGTKEIQEKSLAARYSRTPLQNSASKYHAKIRFKRRSEPLADDDEAWPSSKQTYFEDENAEGIYLDGDTKVKRYANPSREYDEQGYRSSRRKQLGRSIADDRPLIDDPTSKHWTEEKGLQGPASWFDTTSSVRKGEEAHGNQWLKSDYTDGRRESEGSNRIDEFSRRIDDWVESPRDEREAHSPSVRSLARKGVVDEPLTLESLKQTVLELRKSLEDSDKKMEELSEKEGSSGVAKNRERHAEDISGNKEGRVEGEHERSMSGFTSNDKNLKNIESAVSSRYYPGSNVNGYGEINDVSSSLKTDEISGGSSWWQDPRSAADTFDFKRRDDDADDDDDDEDSEPGNSEFDYTMRRVKREKYDDGGENGIRVYRRAGFGGLYPEKKTCERNPEEGINGVRTDEKIREPRLDKINNEGNFDGSESGDRKSVGVNVNENGNPGGEVKEINKLAGSAGVMGKNIADDNPAKESGPGIRSVENGGQENTAGTVGDSNLKDTKKASLLAGDEKRSSSEMGSEEEHKQRLSADEMPGDESAPKSSEMRLDEQLKILPLEPQAETISQEKNEDKNEVDKSEPNDGDDVHKLSKDSNDEKKTKELQESKDQVKSIDHADHLGDKKIKEKSPVSVGDSLLKNVDQKTQDARIKANDEKLAVATIGEKTTDETRVKEDDKGLNFADKIIADQQHERKIESDNHEFEDRVKLEPEIRDETSSQDSKIVEVTDPEKKDIKNTGIDENVGERKMENDVAVNPKERGEETLTRKTTLDEEKCKQENNYEQDKRVMGYGEKENTKCSKRGETEGGEMKNENGHENLDTKVKDLNVKREDLTRKLLWLSEKGISRGDSKNAQIRDGRRDSAWDQNHGEKSGQRPANFLKSNHAAQKFIKRSLMVANDINIADANSQSLGVKKRRGIRSINKDSVSDKYEESDFGLGDKFSRLEKRSLDSYPENVDQEKAEVANDDKEEVLESNSKKRSLQKIIEHQKTPDLAEETYELEDDGPGQDDDDFKDSGANNEGDDNPSVESESQGLSSLDHLSHEDRDRDPMRDRINMLIKQKLDDRGKGGLMHFKREIASIQYYDYDSDVNGVDSDADSTVNEYDQKPPDHQNGTYPEEPPTKKDENAEDEKRREMEQENEDSKEPKEEFISEALLTKVQTKEPSSENSSSQEVESNNETRENQASKSNNQWLGQPPEADSEEEEADSRDGRGRYQDTGEPGERERTLENEKTDILGEPLEYSVNVHGKLDPESIGAIYNEKADAKEKELGESEKRNDKLQLGNDDDWKYEEIRGRSRSQDYQKINDEELEGELEAEQSYSEKSSGSNSRYRDTARIEEGNNDGASLQKTFSHHQIHKNQDVPSREVRLVEKLGQDSLPTMLDRRGPRNLAPGEKTYLMIAPGQVKCPRKPNGENSSSSESNYQALKTTDDMFKGGIEQSNPIDDKIPDINSVGKTTTEWKVIKMTDNARGKLISESYDSSANFGPNSFYNDAMNPRDVVHESFVDPEEMAGDFDDDTRPRFGRDLKYVRESHRHLGRRLNSVSYRIVPFERVNKNVDDLVVEFERPVEKYLENTQSDFSDLERASGRHRIKKRSVTPGREKAEDTMKTDKEKFENESISFAGEKKLGINSGDKNLTKIVNLGEAEKRSTLLKTNPNSNGGVNGNEIDKGKRGLTNVEEWEMNTPTVKKQHLISSANKNTDTFLRDLKKKDALDIKDLSNVTEDKRNIELESSSNPVEKSLSNFDDSVTVESHERESRSVKLRDEDFKSEKIRNKHRSKMRRKTKSYDKFRPSNSVSRFHPFAKYVSSWDSKKKVGNSPRTRNGVIGYNDGWKRLTQDERIDRRHRKSKGNEFLHLNHGNHRSRKAEGSNHRRYQHPPLKKRHNKILGSKETSSHGNRASLRDSSDSKTPLKSLKNHGETSHFKEVPGNHEIQRAMPGQQTTLHSKPIQAAKGYDSDLGPPPVAEKKVLDESAEDPVKVRSELDDAQKKKFTVLLAADNMEDESQMDLALHGELAGKIVERIFDQVQKNDALKVALGPGLYRKHKSEDAIATDKIYRQGLDEDEVKHTEGMMRRVMELLGRLILDEVQRKTCASLPPDMREFLQWMLGVEDDDRTTDQVPPLPFVHNQEQNHRQDDKFLFEGPSTHNENGDIDEVNRKVRLLKSLINEYNALSDKEKTKVQTVHDYLVRQLGLLLNYIDTKEAEGDKNQNLKGVGMGRGNILQYQNAVPNTNGTINDQSTLPPLVNTPSILMLSNASFVEPPVRGISNHLQRTRRHETRSMDEEGVEKKKQRNRRHRKHKHPHSKKQDKRKHKHKKKKNKHHEQRDKKKRGESPEYRKLIRRAAMLRKKRANLYEDNWDPVDSGYEEPAIYTSSGELTNKRKGSFSTRRFDGEYEDTGKTSSPYFWADVLSGKLSGDEEFDENLSNLVARNEKRLDSAEPELETDLQLNLEPKSYEMGLRSKEIIARKEARFDDVDSQKDFEDLESLAGINENSKKKRDLHSSQNSKDSSEKPASGLQEKRDVLSASIALQPWLNPRPDDLVSSAYLKELTNQLVHGSLVPPVNPAGDDKEKRDVGISEGRNIANDEVMLLSKREAWKTENEQQLEEVAFGKDMRGKWREKEQFEKLTGMDRKKNPEDNARRKKREGGEKNYISKTQVETVKNVEDNYGILNENGTTNVLSEGKADPVEKEVFESTITNSTIDTEGPDVEKVELNKENSKNSNVTIGAEAFIPRSKILDSLERKSKRVPLDEKLISEEIPELEEDKKMVEVTEKTGKIEEEQGGIDKLVKPLDSSVIAAKRKSDERSLKRNEFFEMLKNDDSEISNNKNTERKRSSMSKGDGNPFEKGKNKRSSSLLAMPELEGSAILPLLEVSEQREQQKQAAKTEKDDQRDIADQMLGFESPLIVGLNTY